MNQQSKEKCIRVLAKEISEIYDMTYEKALDLVQTSFVPKMLIDDDDAIFMMHEPTQATAQEIMCEYIDRSMCSGTMQNKTAVSYVLAMIRNEFSVDRICDNLKSLSQDVVEAIYRTYELMSGESKKEE